MAVLTARQISQLAVSLLARTLVLPNTVSRVPGLAFSGGSGDTITVRVRQPRTAKTQTPGATISFDPIDEVPVAVTVEQLYDAVRVTDHDLTLNIADFGEQVLMPMVKAVAIGAENQVAAVLNGLTATVGFTDVADTNVEQRLLQARTELSANDAPPGGRFLAVSPSFAEIMLGLENLSAVDKAGSPSALRDAVIGTYRGFQVVESNALTAGTAVAYHMSGLVFANRAPVAPQGAASAESVVAEGISLLTVRDYEISILSEAIAVTTFAGCSLVTEDGDGEGDVPGTEIDRVVKLQLAA